MIIIRDNAGVTIKRRIQGANHVRISVTQTAIWVDGVRRAVRNNGKPYGEFDINECTVLLEELERTEGWAEHASPIEDGCGPECPAWAKRIDCVDCEYETDHNNSTKAYSDSSN